MAEPPISVPPPAPSRLTLDSPGVREAVEEAAVHPLVTDAVEILISDSPVRGCMVSPERPHLQALQNAVGWTLGGYDTRPSVETQKRKHKDRMEVLTNYRQPLHIPGEPLPPICMYDYLCATLFDVPMRPVGPEVTAPTILDDDGDTVTPDWQEADWELFRKEGRSKPAPAFCENKYPYQLPQRTVSEGAHKLQMSAQHWILWYFHFPEEPMPDFPDKVIDDEVRSQLTSVVKQVGFDRFDYIWYSNPNMSAPDMFHVQVFWIVQAN